MGSRTHTQGRGFRPALAGRRDLLAFLDGISQAGADARWGHYVRPLGGGLHLVKNQCNDQPYTVGSAADRTFLPGTSVLLGSNGGTRDEVIIGPASPGRGGGSTFTAVATYRTGRYTVRKPAPAVVCPVPITGRNYLGIVIDHGADLLRAYSYLDGEPGELLGPAVSFAGYTLSIGTDFQRVHPQDTLIFRLHSSGSYQLATWDVGAGTLAIANTASDGVGGPVWPGSGSDMYFQISENFPTADPPVAELRLYKVPIGSSGVINLTTAAAGPLYVDEGNNLACPTILASSGADFQIPAFFFGSDADGIAVPYAVSGSAWSLGLTRLLASGGSNGANGNGYPVTGNRAARVTYFESGNYTVGLLPAAGGSPEVALVPDAWALYFVGNLSNNPGKNHVVLYPANLLTDDFGDNYILRLEVSKTYGDDCALPRTLVQDSPHGAPAVMIPID